jgi:hypothetical protein
MMHDPTCPCPLCEEARQAYQRFLDEHEPHAGCTSVERMCRECREGFERDMQEMAERERECEPEPLDHDQAA